MNTYSELEQTWMLIVKILIWVSVCGNCLLAIRMSQKIKIPSTSYVILLAVVDCLLLAQLFFYLQNQLPTLHGLYSFIVVCSLQSSMCKMAALMSEKILTETCVRRHVSGPGYELLPVKLMPIHVVLCSLSPVSILVVMSQNVDCFNEWRLELKIFQIVVLYVLPLVAMVYLAVGIRRFLTRMAEIKSDYLVVLDNDNKRDKQFTRFIISMAMTSLLTYPVYATFLLVDYLYPDVLQVGIVIAASLTMTLQSGINICLLLVHRAF